MLHSGLMNTGPSTLTMLNHSTLLVNTQNNMIFSGVSSTSFIITAGMFLQHCAGLELLIITLFYTRLHAGAPATIFEDVSSIPISAFHAAIKEYEENSKTDDEGSMLMA